VFDLFLKNIEDAKEIVDIRTRNISLK